MIRAHRIPTRRYPRTLTVICLFVVACVAAVVLSGCGHEQFAGEAVTKQDSDAQTPFLYRDEMTGCEYLATQRDTALTPRYDQNGKQICR